MLFYFSFIHDFITRKQSIIITNNMATHNRNTGITGTGLGSGNDAHRLGSSRVTIWFKKWDFLVFKSFHFSFFFFLLRWDKNA